MLGREIKNATLILSVTTALLYLHGSAFHSGYLRGFGIDSRLLSYGFEETLIQGFRAYTLLGFKALVPIGVVTVIVFVLVGLWTLALKQPKVKRLVHRWIYQ